MSPGKLKEETSASAAGTDGPGSEPVVSHIARQKRSPSSLVLIPPVVFLFVLPFTHTVALRLLALALTAAAAVWVWRCAERRPALPLKLPIVLWVVLALASLFVAADPLYSLEEIKNELGYTLLAFVSFFVLTRGRRELSIFVTAIALSTLVMALMGIGNRLYYGHWYTEGYQGGVGTFSTYIVMVLPYLVFFTVSMPGRLLRLAGIAIAAFALVAAYFTLNRAFWLAFGMEVVVLSGLMVYYSARSTGRRVTVGITGLALAALLAGGGAFVHVVELKRMKVSSVEELVDVLQSDVRLPFWEETADTLSDHVWTGVGFGRHSFFAAYPELRSRPALWHAHNTFLNYWVQMGLPGVLALCLLFAAMVRRYWWFYRAGDAGTMWLGVCGITMVAGFLTKNMTDDFFIRHLALLFWSLAGIALGYGMRNLAGVRHTRLGQPLPRIDGRFSKHMLKTWLRSRSRRFVTNSRPESFGRPVEVYRWKGYPIHYRPGSSDPDLIYKILLKRGRKGEYWVPARVNPGVILDIGGNIGIAAIYYARLFPHATIHTFEPVSDNFRLLLRNTEGYPAINAYQIALGGQENRLHISASADRRNYGGYSFHYTGSAAVDRHVVEVRSAALFLGEIGITQVDLIKIDTEGHESEIIRSLDPAMLSRVSWIIGELHTGAGFELLAYLSEWFDIEVRKSFGKSLFMFNACNRRFKESPTPRLPAD